MSEFIFICFLMALLYFSILGLFWFSEIKEKNLFCYFIAGASGAGILLFIIGVCVFMNMYPVKG